MNTIKRTIAEVEAQASQFAATLNIKGANILVKETHTAFKDRYSVIIATARNVIAVIMYARTVEDLFELVKDKNSEWTWNDMPDFDSHTPMVIEAPTHDYKALLVSNAFAPAL